MPRSDQMAAFLALHRWFVSQDIAAKDAAWLCVSMAGFALGQTTSDRAHLDKGVEILSRALRNSAVKSFEAAQ